MKKWIKVNVGFYTTAEEVNVIKSLQEKLLRDPLQEKPYLLESFEIYIDALSKLKIKKWWQFWIK